MSIISRMCAKFTDHSGMHHTPRVSLYRGFFNARLRRAALLVFIVGTSMCHAGDEHPLGESAKDAQFAVFARLPQGGYKLAWTVRHSEHLDGLDGNLYPYDEKYHVIFKKGEDNQDTNEVRTRYWTYKLRSFRNKTDYELLLYKEHGQIKFQIRHLSQDEEIFGFLTGENSKDYKLINTVEALEKEITVESSIVFVPRDVLADYERKTSTKFSLEGGDDDAPRRHSWYHAQLRNIKNRKASARGEDLKEVSGNRAKSTAGEPKVEAEAGEPNVEAEMQIQLQYLREKVQQYMDNDRKMAESHLKSLAEGLEVKDVLQPLRQEIQNLCTKLNELAKMKKPRKQWFGVGEDVTFWRILKEVTATS